MKCDRHAIVRFAYIQLSHLSFPHHPPSTLQSLCSLGWMFHWNGEALTGWASQGGSGWEGYGSPASHQTVSSCSLLPSLSHPSTFCPGACWEIWQIKCILLISAIPQYSQRLRSLISLCLLSEVSYHSTVQLYTMISSGHF